MDLVAGEDLPKLLRLGLTGPWTLRESGSSRAFPDLALLRRSQPKNTEMRPATAGTPSLAE